MAQLLSSHPTWLPCSCRRLKATDTQQDKTRDAVKAKEAKGWRKSYIAQESKRNVCDATPVNPKEF
ncbi:hypothetical protein SCLCIDRAFT_1220075 [Scleroderma citrinum Foug A]|uniref:Uncharacterized protein n=1 Tax=Scleroderma citrinum Foug A TaxID=1036808 RepID=A0A0C2Z4D5_9AGAM|nr:hypothetical protein SCLCIDRAFT_1220075 [Scleroderma citrinum Foug A]